jgi:hypothetical protein
MESIKLQRGTNKIRLGRFWYKPYLIGSLPPSFAFLYDEDDDTSGINRWFNYKGLTYVKDEN